MVRAARRTSYCSRAQLKRPLAVAAAALALSSTFKAGTAQAAADCISNSVAAPIQTAEIPIGARSGSHAISFTPKPAAAPAPCQRSGGTSMLSMAMALQPRSNLSRPVADGHSTNPRFTTGMHDESPSAARTSWASPTSLEGVPGLDGRFGVRWQVMPGPAWVQRVPTWLIDDAKTYHRRGLPVLRLWQSPHYLVALGLSNHGVPGVYFSQKLP